MAQRGLQGHAKQFKRLRKCVKRQRTVLGIVIREVQRKLKVPGFEAKSALALTELSKWLERAEREVIGSRPGLTEIL